MATPVITPDLLAKLNSPAIPAPSLMRNELGAPLGSHNELGAAMPSYTAPPDPVAPVAPTQMQQDQARRNMLVGSGSGIDQIHNPLLRGLARSADILGSVFGPTRALEMAIPGTTLHHQVLVNQAERNLANDQLAQQKQDASAQAQATTDQTKANTDYLEQKPEIEQAKIQQKMDVANNKNAATLAPHGFIYSVDPDTHAPVITEDLTSQAYKERVALADMHNATTQVDNIKAENSGQRYIPGTPQYDEWHQRLVNAQNKMQLNAASLGMSRERLNFQQDKFYNPQPTGTERTKGDMANSALEQIQTMRTLLKAHPEFAGPGAGARQAFQRWLSSNGEDAGKFLASRQYLSDHSAAVFGGRGEYISKQMEGLTDPNFSPSTLGGVLDQAEETSRKFSAAGQTHTKTGQLRPAQSAPSGDPLGIR